MQLILLGFLEEIPVLSHVNVSSVLQFLTTGRDDNAHIKFRVNRFTDPKVETGGYKHTTKRAFVSGKLAFSCIKKAKK